jgi:Cu-Zn family superoxide dismutase
VFPFITSRPAYIRELANAKPQAIAEIRGSAKHRGIAGKALFYQSNRGVIIVAEVEGLPVSPDTCGNSIFAFHIHEGSSCEGNTVEPFPQTGGHYNPTDCPHPQHAGDLPPLFSNNGYAFMAVLTNRFTIRSIIGRTVVIHSQQDDFTSQPAGNSGEKIACGEIYRLV